MGTRWKNPTTRQRSSIRHLDRVAVAEVLVEVAEGRAIVETHVRRRIQLDPVTVGRQDGETLDVEQVTLNIDDDPTNRRIC